MRACSQYNLVFVRWYKHVSDLGSSNASDLIQLRTYESVQGPVLLGFVFERCELPGRRVLVLVCVGVYVDGTLARVGMHSFIC